jgi:hypothetical protein
MLCSHQQPTWHSLTAKPIQHLLLVFSNQQGLRFQPLLL